MPHEKLIKSGLKHLLKTLKGYTRNNKEQVNKNSYKKLTEDLTALLSSKAESGQELMRLQTQGYDLRYLMESAGFPGSSVPDTTWVFNFQNRTVHYNEELVYQG